MNKLLVLMFLIMISVSACKIDYSKQELQTKVNDNFPLEFDIDKAFYEGSITLSNPKIEFEHNFARIYISTDFLLIGKVKIPLLKMNNEIKGTIAITGVPKVIDKNIILSDIKIVEFTNDSDVPNIIINKISQYIEKKYQNISIVKLNWPKSWLVKSAKTVEGDILAIEWGIF